MENYKFYMQKVLRDANGVYQLVDSKVDLEEDFKGLRYSKCVGIDTIGKAKNIYTETYSDSAQTRVYVPNTIVNEATSVTLTLFFIGKDCEDVMENFLYYVRNGIHRYWDTARNRYFDFYVMDEIKVAEENRKTGTPYIKLDLKLNNIYGETYKVNF